jgi:hypothetical protein
MVSSEDLQVLAKEHERGIQIFIKKLAKARLAEGEITSRNLLDDALRLYMRFE